MIRTIMRGRHHRCRRTSLIFQPSRVSWQMISRYRRGRPGRSSKSMRRVCISTGLDPLTRLTFSSTAIRRLSRPILRLRALLTWPIQIRRDCSVCRYPAALYCRRVPTGSRCRQIWHSRQAANGVGQTGQFNRSRERHSRIRAAALRAQAVTGG